MAMRNKQSDALFGILVRKALERKGRKRSVLKLVCEKQPDVAERCADLVIEAATALEQGLPKLTTVFTPDSFQLTVNYGEPLADLIKRGKYDYANENVTAEHFPTTRKEKATLTGRLVHLGRDLSTEAVERKLGEMGLRLGEPHELLTFGVVFPEVQREYPIVALGQRWRGGGDEYVPCLHGWRGGRRLHLAFVEFVWIDYCRFLAFPK